MRAQAERTCGACGQAGHNRRTCKRNKPERATRGRWSMAMAANDSPGRTGEDVVWFLIEPLKRDINRQVVKDCRRGMAYADAYRSALIGMCTWNGWTTVGE